MHSPIVVVQSMQVQQQLFAVEIEPIDEGEFFIKFFTINFSSPDIVMQEGFSSPFLTSLIGSLHL